MQTADLVTRIRPAAAAATSSSCASVAGNLDDNKAELDRALQVLPIKLNKVGRTAIYGSWFNFYLCDFEGRVEPAPTRSASARTTTRRLQVA